MYLLLTGAYIMTFLIASVLILVGVAVKIPKNMTRVEMYSTTFFAMALQMTTDMYLDVQYNLYTYFYVGADLVSFIPMLGLYPPANIILLNYFPYKKGVIWKLNYIIIWAVSLVVFEWLSIKAGYFHHFKWNLWYSFFCYLGIIPILALNLHIQRKLRQKDMQSS